MAAGTVHLIIVSEGRRQKHLFIGYINQINLVKFTKAGRKAIRSVLWLCPKTEATLSVLKQFPPGKLRVQAFIWLLSCPALHILNLFQALLKTCANENPPAHRDLVQ